MEGHLAVVVGDEGKQDPEHRDVRKREVSEDGGNTFPKRYEVPISCPHGPIVLKDGRYFYVGRAFGIKEAWRTDKRSYE